MTPGSARWAPAVAAIAPTATMRGRTNDNARMSFDLFPLGAVTLQSGATLPDARLVYKTHGKLNAAKDNAVLIPTFYSGTHVDNESMLGPGRALDPARHFIIVPNMLGNGLSSSPSNTPPPFDRARFPRVTVYDNV